MKLDEFDIALVLAGGAALGAYQGGAYAALHDAGLLPGHVVGSSVGAFNATLIAGNAPADRVARLRAFWDGVAEPLDGSEHAPPHGYARQASSRLASLRMRVMGRTNFATPQFLEALAPAPLRSPGLYDLSPALGRVVELAALPGPGSGAVRLTVQATDVATGEPVTFASAEQQFELRHLRASASLLPDFPPTEVDGRLLCDGAFSANLPLRPVLGHLPDRPTLCIAVDLIPRAAEPRWSVDGMAERQQDLQFASQTHLLIEALEQRLALAAQHAPRPVPVVLAHLVHHGREDAGAQKTYDFSRRSVEGRWARGHADALAMVTELLAAPAPDARGLTVWRFGSRSPGLTVREAAAA